MKKTLTTNDAITRYGRSRLARQLGISATAVSKWVKTAVPLERCPEIEHVTGIPVELLRPDVYWNRHGGKVIGYTVVLQAA